MRLVVTNLGPLREAEVDLTHPFTVFAGPNNSGKTWLATVIYALRDGMLLRPRAALDGMLRRLIEAGAEGVTVDAFRDFVARAVTDHVDAVRDGLPRAFAAHDALFERTTIQVVDLAVGELHTTRIEFGAKRPSLLVSEGRVHLDPRQDGMPELPLDESNQALRASQRLVIGFAGTRAARLLVRARFFPAERAAISLFSRELAAQRLELVDDALTAGDEGEQLLARRASPYPLPIRDALSAAIRTPGLRDNTTEFAPLVDQLERDVLGGALQLNADGDVRFVSFGQGRPDLGLHHSASLVKSLASLALYVRHEARRGDLLIVDEPELNLHPDNQRRVARFLAQVARAGVRVLISTHSDYILRELSNLVTLGAAGESGQRRAAELKYPVDALLSPSDLGVYFFHDGTAERLPVGNDGFSVASIEAEIRSLDIDTQRILFPADDA